MKIRVAVVGVIAVALLAACRPARGQVLTPGSGQGVQGIEGQVLIGPMCPVQRVDTPCPDKPYQANISVLDQNGTLVLSFQTDDQGRFRVALDPGTYTLRPDAGIGIAHAEAQDVTVQAGAFTPVQITYDSGIR